MKATGQEVTIVMIEDDEGHARLIEKNVRRAGVNNEIVPFTLGHKALEAYSGKQALEILASDAHVDALITDYAMPGMTGVELAEKARELRPDLPVLLATGYADLPSGTTTDLPRLAKPYHQADLATQIGKLLQGRGAAGA